MKIKKLLTLVRILQGRNTTLKISIIREHIILIARRYRIRYKESVHAQTQTVFPHLMSGPSHLVITTFYLFQPCKRLLISNLDMVFQFLDFICLRHHRANTLKKFYWLLTFHLQTICHKSTLTQNHLKNQILTLCLAIGGRM